MKELITIDSNNTEVKGKKFNLKTMIICTFIVLVVIGLCWTALEFWIDKSSVKNIAQVLDVRIPDVKILNEVDVKVPNETDVKSPDIKAQHKADVKSPDIKAQHKADVKTLHKSVPEEHKTVEHKPKPAMSEHKSEYIEHPLKEHISGVLFVSACIKSMNYELNKRFWGWRSNDIIKVTDNVNNLQRGVLEVTRRTVMILAEQISRTGSADAFDENLENAMNWFMVKSDEYWFPSAEKKYNDGLNELRIYLHKLKRGEANFYSRTDNLLPLLRAYESLLGSCDENLVKIRDEFGKNITSFKADDYLYYAKGVASTIGTILEAIHEDFHEIINGVQATEIIHHAIISCHHASEIEPLIVFECSPSSIFANHRANMAAPISHARFYIGLLITALTT
ncbi:hypothetical protein GMMP15_730041 [Candidatus Magnetomoraceae bacterium gMMP-15]